MKETYSCAFSTQRVRRPSRAVAPAAGRRATGSAKRARPRAPLLRLRSQKCGAASGRTAIASSSARRAARSRRAAPPRLVHRAGLAPLPAAVVAERIVALAHRLAEARPRRRARRSRAPPGCGARCRRRACRAVRLDARPMFSAVWLQSSFSITSWFSGSRAMRRARREGVLLELRVGHRLEDEADLGGRRAPGSRRRSAGSASPARGPCGRPTWPSSACPRRAPAGSRSSRSRPRRSGRRRAPCRCRRRCTSPAPRRSVGFRAYQSFM